MEYQCTVRLLLLMSLLLLLQLCDAMSSGICLRLCKLCCHTLLDGVHGT
jgi:hypothetical protein